MQSRVRFLGHSLHQMLIVFPLGLLATAVVFDIAYLASDSSLMSAVAYWMMAAGLVGAFAAAPVGFIDWLAITPGTRAKRIGKIHGLGNVVVTLLFLGSWLLRGNADSAPGALAMLLSFAGAALALFTAWLGGELVARMGVGVYERAGLDAPNSLSEAQPRPGHSPSH